MENIYRSDQELHCFQNMKNAIEGSKFLRLDECMAITMKDHGSLIDYQNECCTNEVDLYISSIYFLT